MIPVTQNIKNWDWRLNSIPVTMIQDGTAQDTMAPKAQLEEDKRC